LATTCSFILKVPVTGKLIVVWKFKTYWKFADKLHKVYEIVYIFTIETDDDDTIVVRL